jgi:hypothetical protein
MARLLVILVAGLLSEPDRVGSATRDIAIERGNMTFYFRLMTCLLLSLLLSLVSFGLRAFRR